MRRLPTIVLAILLAFAAALGATAPAPREAVAATATTTDALNLRAGPGTWHPIVLTMPAGSGVSVTGDPRDGFYPVTYAGRAGWASGPYLTLGGTRTTTTTAAVNLRTGPSFVDWVIAVVPAGATVDTTGGAVNGFLPVWYAGSSGWVAAAYLAVSGGAAPAQGQGGTITWPFQNGSGAWVVSQGYNGPWSHWNAGPYYQYRYSLDLQRVDGNTAGQPVLSPVTGTIRWIDWAAGGMSIDLGNGYAVSYFHTYVGGWLAEGQRVNQGDYLGAVAWPWEKQNGGSPHLHLSLWQTTDGGNWSRVAAPFTGRFAIEGVDLPDWWIADQHAGTVVWP